MQKADANGTWVKVLDPNFLNADLIGPPGSELIVTIKEVHLDEECNDPNSTKGLKKKVNAIYFVEDVKPVVLNATKIKFLNRVFGQYLGDAYGKKIILRNQIIRAFGKDTTSIQFAEYTETKCEKCGEVVQPTRRMTVSQVIDYSRKNCKGKALCMKCMTEEAKKGKES